MSRGTEIAKGSARPRVSRTRTSQLTDALRQQSLVRFSQRFEAFRIHGYVLDIGPKFFLLAVVSDRIWFDGFECFQINDVKDVRPDPRVDFVESALKKRGERLAKKPPVSVVSIGDLLLTAGRVFPLVTIHRERLDPDICHIGRVKAVSGGHLSLLEINPDAAWDNVPMKYRLSEITRVNFGSDYENALHLVGGEPAGV